MSDTPPNYFDLLPNEILIIEVFGYFVVATDLLAVSAVCKRFNACSNDDGLWKKVCMRSGLQLERIVTTTMTTNTAYTLCDHKEIYLREKHRFHIFCALHSVIYKKGSKDLFVAGLNDSGQLGLSDNTARYQFVQLFLPFPVIECKGFWSTLILNADNSIHSCGDNQYGQLGLNHKNHLNKLIKIPSFCVDRIVQISVSQPHSACITQLGECYTWGSNMCGALGMSRDIRQLLKPTLLPFKEKFSSISCGDYFTVAIAQDRKKVYGWGSNEHGQLAIGNFGQQQFEPILSLFSSILDKDPSDTYISSISSVDGFSVITTSNGQCWSSGSNTRGQLGIGNDDEEAKICIPQQVLIPSSGHIVKVSSPWNHCIALTKDGKCYVWGDNSQYQLGINTNDNPQFQLGINTNESYFISTPQELSLPHDIPFIDISAGVHHSIAVNLNNEIFGWGSNQYGQLGKKEELKYFAVPTLLHLSLNASTCTVS